MDRELLLQDRYAMISLILPFLLAATTSTPCHLTAIRVDEKPSIDGILNEAVWDQAHIETCVFTQYAPDFGQPMSEPTEISVLYDDDFLYFGFIMGDPDPETMMAGLSPRDNYVTGEWIAVLLDTYNDGRQASSFEVSLANSQMDSKVNPNGHWDYTWDAVWESGTSRTAKGWSAEIAVPFSCLRFDTEHEDQIWGVNFQRILSKGRENGWFVLTESNQMADLNTFAHINGISGISRSLGAEIRTYGATQGYRIADDDSWENNHEIGADVKLGVSTGIAADITLNPDFGQVEADAVEMNLSHFELFLQEKRPFFLESRNIFDMPFNMFYSRRIGTIASNGDVIPIVGGGKLSGSLGNDIRFGLLNAVTSRVWDHDTLVEPAANFGIFRTYKQYGNHSYLGISAVSKDTWEQEDRDSEYNRSFAIDGAVEFPRKNVVHAAVARSWNTGDPVDNAYLLEMDRVRSSFSYSLGTLHVGDDFSVNSTGYTTWTGFTQGWAGAYYNLRPEKVCSEIGFGTNANYRELTSGEVTDRQINIDTHAVLKSQARFGAHITFSGDRYDPYEGPTGHHYDAYTDIFFDAGSNPFDPFSVWAGVGTGQYSQGGTYGNYNTRIKLRPSAAFDLSVEGEYYRTSGSNNYNREIGSFDTRETDWRSAILRANYIFTPDLNLRLFSQYSRFEQDFDSSRNFEARELRTNILFGWQYVPGSMLYILAEHLMESDGSGGFKKPNFGLYAKLTWYLPV